MACVRQPAAAALPATSAVEITSASFALAMNSVFAVVIIVTVADEDVLAFDVFFFCDIPCIAGQEWVENHGYVAACEHKARVAEIS